MKRLRAFLESIVYAGLKPAGQKAQGPERKWLGPLRGPVERLLSGGAAPSDPLYLTNRTFGQKIRSWALIGIPCLILVVCVGLALSNLLEPPAAKPAKELTPAEVAAKILPNVAKDIQLNTNPDVQVMEVSVRQEGGARVVGVVHNNTAHEITAVGLVVDLTNSMGSQVGGVSGEVEKLPANSDKSFQIAIQQRDAAFALVREVTTR
jgi:hypothetical protein